jgi:hypothetical protein
LSALDPAVFDVALFEGLGEEDLDNTGAVRDHFLSLYRNAESGRPMGLYYACRPDGFNIPVVRQFHVFRLQSSMFHPRSAAP